MLHLTTRTITALAIVAAILVPTASAQPIDPPGASVATTAHGQTHNDIPLGVERASGGVSPAAQSTPSTPAPTTRPSSGFDWGDAAVGAAGMLIVLTLSAAGLVTIRRSRERGQPALTS